MRATHGPGPAARIILASGVAALLILGSSAGWVSGGSPSPEATDPIGAASPPSSAGPATQASTDVAGAAFLPAATIAYLELRGDLPDDQAEALTEVIARFPGFGATQGFEAEADRALDMLLAQGTAGALSWTQDIRPWFDGRVSVGLLDDRASLFAGEPSLIAGLELTDADAAAAFADGLVAMAYGDVPDAVDEEPYRGATVVSSTDGSWAYAVTGDLLLLGTGGDEVREGLDVLAGAAPGLASSEGFQAAFARMPEGRILAGYMDALIVRSYLETAMVALDDPTLDTLRGLLEVWPLDLSFALAARPDGMILEVVATPGPGTPAAVDGQPHLADVFPSGTQLLMEVPDLGRSIVDAVRLAATWLPNTDAGTVDTLVASVGNLLGWAGDTAVGAGFDGTGLWLGAVVETGEPAAADVYVGAAQALIALAWMGIANDPYAMGPPFTTEVSSVDGATVTTVSLTQDGREIGLPIEPSLSIAQDDGRVIVGSSAFVSESLGLDAGASLAGDPRYAEALAATGSADVGHVYLDVHGLWEALAPLLAMRTGEFREMAPYVEPLDRLVLAFGVEDDGTRTTTLRLLLR